ncbi:P-loop containing nucleoside triphosphate hydrolase protein [Phascolomyces articulosus]|uniref:P-loop containing nucleoside triphosphate hydrolase protein n=1 Tax=Phascolomyces articulosus TaxID=60185 RepID=A0AAD5JZI1_9FUNG|nr:P-loop containing nucleoside triphosphate hydrolase protein [Phascolomyces articulosus]
MITVESSSPSLPRSNNNGGPIGGTFVHRNGADVFIHDRIDNVQDAVDQALFNEKRWVWVEDEKHGFVEAQIIQDDGKQYEVQLKGGEIRYLSVEKIYYMNPPKFDRVSDMAELTHLNEPAVVHNLTSRYRHNEIYASTYSGLFLVAVNPYRKLPIYTDEYIQSYKGRRRGELPPHIYAVAEEAYRDMAHGKNDQTILITGESGAGKTENTKIVIQYLAAVGNTAIRSRIEQQILQANPILEAFGNAQTIRNNNSSRFGKYIRINFNSQAQICGAEIEWYLLEKSRVHGQSPSERNYHIFYQLLNGDESIKEKLLLGGKTAHDYNFTKDSNMTIDGIDDAKDFEKLVKSMEIMGLSEEEQFDYFRIIAAVLHIGNLSVSRDFGFDRSDVHIEPLCHLLGVAPQEFRNSFLGPRIKAGPEWVRKGISQEQLRFNVVALAKALYERNFSSLVDRINQGLDGVKSMGEQHHYIGVLDIAGFEIFEVNSFEQLCINYTNEKLQQFFNHSMFILEQSQYRAENIDWEYIDFGLDLKPTIDLIESIRPSGILSTVEEQCYVPRGCDKKMLHYLNNTWGNKKNNSSGKYEMSRFDDDSFIVKHYAGKVKYYTKGWVEKNKDPLNEDVTRLLARSSNAYVARLFKDYLYKGTSDEPTVGLDGTLSKPTRLRQGSGSFRTVGQRHRQQLAVLMTHLGASSPRFIRCILPNSHKRAGEINTPLVLDQLRCNGVLEGIRICRKGFPNRMAFEDFRKRFQILYPDDFPLNKFMYGRKACELLLDKMALDPELFRIGVSKVFFKATALAELEEVRNRHLATYMTGFQAMCRRYIARQRMTRVARQTEAIRVIQRNARIYVTLREWPWWKIYSKVRSMGEAMKDDIIIEEQGQKIHQQEKQINEQTHQIQDLMTQYQNLTIEYKGSTDTVTRQEAMIQEFEESKRALIEKLDMCEEEMEKITKQSEAQANMIARLHQDIKECNEENEQWVTQYKGLQNTHETVSARVEYLENENERLLKEKKQEEKLKKEDVDAMRKELEELKKSSETQILALKVKIYSYCLIG